MTVEAKEAIYLPHPTSSEPAAQAALTTPLRLIRSRRRRWISQNPFYITTASADVELSDPLSYDRLIRQHQSAAERETEGKSRGWAKTLETSLIRGEAKLEAARQQAQPANGNDPVSSTRRSGNDAGATPGTTDTSTDWTIGLGELTQNGNDSSNVQPQSRPDESKLRAQEQWHELIAQRFIDGRDETFDYSTIDEDDSLDVDEGMTGSWQERKVQEEWFDGESEDDVPANDTALTGQTGVQDF